MITVEISTALLIYLGFFLFLCFGAWLISHLAQRRKQALPSFYNLAICEYCTNAYLAKAGEEVSKCPGCNTFNKNNLYRPSRSV